MQLYGSFTSPYVRHVRIALLETGLDCEFVETDSVASAEQSPTMKVPFLRDGNIELTDSMSILRYIREKAGEVFLPTVVGLDIYCLVNTLMDSTVNLFMLERFGLDVSENVYLQRQKARVDTGLKYLNSLDLKWEDLDKDSKLRLECFLVWGCYRNRFSLGEFSQLSAITERAKTRPEFISTVPPKD